MIIDGKQLEVEIMDEFSYRIDNNKSKVKKAFIIIAEEILKELKFSIENSDLYSLSLKTYSQHKEIKNEIIDNDAVKLNLMSKSFQVDCNKNENKGAINMSDENKLTLKSGDYEITPDKFIGILQEGMSLESLTTGNFTLKELKDIKFFFLDFINSLMEDKLKQSDRYTFRQVKNKRDDKLEDLEYQLEGKEFNLFNKYFKEQGEEVEEVFNSKDVPEHLQDEVKEFVADLLSDVPPERIKELEEANPPGEKKEKKDKDVINLANYSQNKD